MAAQLALSGTLRVGTRLSGRLLFAAATALALLITALLAADNAFANVATPQSSPPPTVNVVDNANGTVSVSATGTWKWTTLKNPSTTHPCDSRFGVGWAMIWRDPDDSGTVLSYDGGKVKVGVGSKGVDPANTDDMVTYDHSDPCGTFDAATGAASGSWTGTHVYESLSALPSSICVVTYDITGRNTPNQSRLLLTNADNSVRDALQNGGTWDQTPGGPNCFEVSPTKPPGGSLSTTATNGKTGHSISDTATLSGTVRATGTITFSAYGPNDPRCARAPAFTATLPVDGNGTYGPVLFVPQLNLRAVQYRWVALYSGDANNAPLSEQCGTPSEISTYRN
jgi:hypothetical protein